MKIRAEINLRQFYLFIRVSLALALVIFLTNINHCGSLDPVGIGSGNDIRKWCGFFLIHFYFSYMMIQGSTTRKAGKLLKIYYFEHNHEKITHKNRILVPLRIDL
jgi:hypothetical protein